ncbi:hypothetical protein THAOC_01893, partial [Thalassiosira oceanica]
AVSARHTVVVVEDDDVNSATTVTSYITEPADRASPRDTCLPELSLAPEVPRPLVRVHLNEVPPALVPTRAVVNVNLTPLADVRRGRVLNHDLAGHLQECPSPTPARSSSSWPVGARAEESEPWRVAEDGPEPFLGLLFRLHTLAVEEALVQHQRRVVLDAAVDERLAAALLGREPRRRVVPRDVPPRREPQQPQRAVGVERAPPPRDRLVPPAVETRERVDEVSLTDMPSRDSFSPQSLVEVVRPAEGLPCPLRPGGHVPPPGRVSELSGGQPFINHRSPPSNLPRLRVCGSGPHGMSRGRVSISGTPYYTTYPQRNVPVFQVRPPPGRGRKSSRADELFECRSLRPKRNGRSSRPPALSQFLAPLAPPIRPVARTSAVVTGVPLPWMDISGRLGRWRRAKHQHAPRPGPPPPLRRELSGGSSLQRPETSPLNSAAAALLATPAASPSPLKWRWDRERDCSGRNSCVRLLAPSRVNASCDRPCCPLAPDAG